MALLVSGCGVLLAAWLLLSDVLDWIRNTLRWRPESEDDRGASSDNGFDDDENVVGVDDVRLCCRADAESAVRRGQRRQQRGGTPYRIARKGQVRMISAHLHSLHSEF